MNKVILMGRLARDPEIRYTQGSDSMAVARYTLAVDKFGHKDSDGQNADFIQCVAFKEKAEFAEKYLSQGTKIVTTGRIQTRSYKNKEGRTVYTFEIVIEEQEFAESKGSRNTTASTPPAPEIGDGFMNISEGINEELPFN